MALQTMMPKVGYQESEKGLARQAQFQEPRCHVPYSYASKVSMLAS